jgi:hypothetical protein
MKNIRGMDEEKTKKMRSERHNAEVVDVCAAPRTLLIFRTFFFAAHWNREREIKFPHTKRVGILCLKKSRGAS